LEDERNKNEKKEKRLKKIKDHGSNSMERESSAHQTARNTPKVSTQTHKTIAPPKQGPKQTQLISHTQRRRRGGGCGGG
jgi:hypothetical protein